ncbi:holo-ACP synthase [Bartonella sp. DGB2]|uniref:holo-ACP synthase n=1 Tax=Bartonella sp. DGB2 TaxID=3388426 RepID=UPI0039903017
MILGIGSDIVDIRRIEATLKRYDRRFIERIFTQEEQKKSEANYHRAASYAKRFAAKEACAKALGTGIACGVFWRDIEVMNDLSGKPSLRLKNLASLMMQNMLPKVHHAVIHLTMTDDFPYAQAFVIIEAVACADIPTT